MPNIKQQIKRVKTNEQARNRNAQFKSRVRTQIKKVKALAAAGNKVEAEKELRVVFSLLDKAGKKGVLHANKVSRHKSDLMLLVNKL